MCEYMCVVYEREGEGGREGESVCVLARAGQRSQRQGSIEPVSKLTDWDGSSNPLLSPPQG